jgi:hypothetical protein
VARFGPKGAQRCSRVETLPAAAHDVHELHELGGDPDFDVNLVTGEEHGRVYLLHHIAGPKVRCTLDVVGTGLNGDGNPTFDYTGECIFRGQ